MFFFIVVLLEGVVATPSAVVSIVIAGEWFGNGREARFRPVRGRVSFPPG